MAASAAVQSALRGNPRAGGETFADEGDANDRVAFLKAAGERNVRKRRFADYVKQDGTKVYRWIVRCDA